MESESVKQNPTKTEVPKYRKVTKEEFVEYISSQSPPLEREVRLYFEPPLTVYHDPTIVDAELVDADVVAYVKNFDGSEYHDFKQPEFFVIERVESE